MSKFLFFGDSITDAWRGRDAEPNEVVIYGSGYVNRLAGDLMSESPQNKVYNRGICGNRIVDLYARIKQDFWSIEPDCATILIGVNDVWHEVHDKNGVELDRFETVYRMLIQDTKVRFPEMRIILMEPFVLHGKSTTPWYEQFLKVLDYAKVVEKIAKEFSLEFVPLQQKFNELAAINGEEYYLGDGVHPTVVGAKVIADEWLKVYKKNANN